jgi:hypothetical protein
MVCALQNEIMLYEKLWNCVLQQTMNDILNQRKKKNLRKGNKFKVRLSHWLLDAPNIQFNSQGYLNVHDQKHITCNLEFIKNMQ